MTASEMVHLINSAQLAKKLTKHYSVFKRDLNNILKDKGGYSRIYNVLRVLGDYVTNRFIGVEVEIKEEKKK